MPWRKINSHRGFVGGRWGSEQTSAGGTGSPPGIRRRKAGTDHRTVVADHGDGNTRRIPLRTAVEGMPREARKRRITRHLLDNHLFVNSISRSNFSIAPPLSITFPASSYPSCKVLALSHATKAGAAFRQTTSRFDPFRPRRISRVVWAFSSAVPPARSFSRTRSSPKSLGSRR